MTLDIDQKIAALRQLTVPQLRIQHQELFGEPPRSTHKQHLVRRIAWRIQALAEGDLSERARRRAAELACDADLRLRAPRRHRSNASQRTGRPNGHRPNGHRPNGPLLLRDPRLPLPGTLLVRSYRGENRQVKVLEQGFEYDDDIYSSLTAVVNKITGKHWNGYHFFGLTKGQQ